MDKFTNINTVINENNRDYVIIDSYPKIDYTLIYREHPFAPWVAAWAYIPEKGSWCQGHYFSSLLNRTTYIKKLMEERV